MEHQHSSGLVPRLSGHMTAAYGVKDWFPAFLLFSMNGFLPRSKSIYQYLREIAPLRLAILETGHE